MQSTVPVIRRPALPRYGFRSALLAGSGCAVVLAACISPAGAQVLVRDLQPISMQFSSAAQDGIRAHQAQVRARQVRVRQSKNRSALPRIANNMTMSGDQGSIPLQVRNAPQSPPMPGLKPIEASNIGIINSFIRGDLHTDSDNGTASGLSTNDLTVGSDYRLSEDFTFGVAAGRMNTGEAIGTTVSAYVTLQPLDRIFLDMSLSYGVHQARDNESLRATGVPQVSVEGVSRAFSVSLNHPRKIGDWAMSPYSRFDHIVTDVDTRSTSAPAMPASFGLSAMALGSTAATTWATPFGAVRPIVMVEIQKEVITVAGVGTTSSQTQGIVGFGMSTKVSRDMSAFAESRYQSDLAATLDRQMMLGVKFAF